MQVAYELRDIFRNFTGSRACFGSPPAGSNATDEYVSLSHEQHDKPSARSACVKPGQLLQCQHWSQDASFARVLQV
jgi:hypothetical protein